ncbi:MAG: hypothetical protein AUH92_06730 [Acidobacteria bacterium 13_1_40CM_4_69_4]|nr:MAG: hypothetical protein AUH92_06730 [Acidobacteria bacterium 13_1_40CM_4_69_4]
MSAEAALRRDEDVPLVAQAQSGDLEAFETLVLRHGRRVYRVLLGITGDHADAEDGAQNTFLKAYQHIREFEGASKFSSWLTRIAANEGLEILRRRKTRRKESLDEWLAEHEDTFLPRNHRPWQKNPEQLVSEAQVRELVEKEIMKLPAKYRVAVMLRDLEQLSTEEAATALGLKEATLKTRLLRGRLMLREALAQLFGRRRGQEAGDV